MKRPAKYFRSCPTDGTTVTSVQNSVPEIFRRTVYILHSGRRETLVPVEVP
jgi:hypothetical protein